MELVTLALTVAITSAGSVGLAKVSFPSKGRKQTFIEAQRDRYELGQFLLNELKRPDILEDREKLYLLLDQTALLLPKRYRNQLKTVVQINKSGIELDFNTMEQLRQSPYLIPNHRASISSVRHLIEGLVQLSLKSQIEVITPNNAVYKGYEYYVSLNRSKSVAETIVTHVPPVIEWNEINKAVEGFTKYSDLFNSRYRLVEKYYQRNLGKDTYV